MSSHASLSGLELHQPFHYIQETDPGAVGAGLLWLKKSTRTMSYRNDLNTGWVTILAPSNSLALPLGSTWQDILDAYDNIDPGDELILPNETVIQESTWHLTKPARILGGPLSSLKLLTNVALFGGSVQLMVHDTVLDPTYALELGNFKIEHDRSTTDRCIAISIHHRTKDISIHHIVGTTLSSTFVIVRADAATIVAEGDAISPHNIVVSNCDVDQYYEAFFEIREGNCYNVSVVNNTSTTSSGHPNPAVSRPQAICLNMENSPGIVKYFTVASNSFVNTMANKNATLGLLAQWEGDAATNKIRYEHISFHGNLVSGWQNACRLSFLNGGLFNIGAPDSVPAYMAVESNIFEQNTAENILVDNIIGSDIDNLVIADNDIAVLGGANSITVNNGSTSNPTNVVVTQIANRIT